MGGFLALEAADGDVDRVPGRDLADQDAIAQQQGPSLEVPGWGLGLRIGPMHTRSNAIGGCLDR